MHVPAKTNKKIQWFGGWAGAPPLTPNPALFSRVSRLVRSSLGRLSSTFLGHSCPVKATSITAFRQLAICRPHPHKLLNFIPASVVQDTLKKYL